MREGRAHGLDPPGISAAPARPAAPAEMDLAYAKAAAAALLGAAGQGCEPALGEPRHRGARNGHATADAYTSDGFQCRDFLASYIRDGAESWLQGDACRIHQGKWTVRSMRPLKRTVAPAGSGRPRCRAATLHPH